jgi:hypothetical protein
MMTIDTEKLRPGAARVVSDKLKAESEKLKEKPEIKQVGLH